MGTESDKQAVKPGRRQLQRTAAAPAQSAAGRLHGRLSGTLSIPDFCDMELFEQVLRDWAQSTGLATVAIGSDGRYLSGYYNFTDFCEKLTRLSPEGLRRCTECDKNGAGVYQCHAGLVDFASPITLADGTVLGNILGGQVLPKAPDEAKFRATARELGIEEEVYLEALRRVNIRTPEEIEASAKLLGSVVNLFVRTSYAARQNARSLLERSRIIASLSKIYFCDYYLDLAADSFLELDAPRVMHHFTGHRGKTSKLLEEAARVFVQPDYEADFKRFTDMATLKQRLGRRTSITLDFISRDYGWCRASFIVAARDLTGLVSHVILAVQDIREEKSRELRTLLELQNAAAESNRANQVKSDFLARMSHDMRTPLTTIIGLSDLAGERYKDRELEEYFGIIRDSSRYLLSILNDILDMQKLSSSKLKLNPVICREAETARTVEAVIRPMAEAKGIRFVTEFHCQEAGCYLKIDTRQVQRLIVNLLTNAVKYTPAGGEVKWATTLVREEADKVICRHTISDNGPGIPEDFQQVMYEPFTQAKAQHSSNGSGLGLAIVRKLVDLLGGTIQCSSRLGEGTTFTVTLPHLKADAREAAAFLQERRQEDAGLYEGRHVLVCEDNKINAQIIRRLLQLKKITSDWAENGAEAVRMVRENSAKPYQAVLMDIRMPVMDGYEATRQIRTFNKQVPIIALSANNFAEDVEKSLASGMNAHLAKPVDMKKLLTVLQKVF